MSFLENFKLKENKLFESSLSSNNKSHKRYSSVKSENEISLKQNFYKTETKKYNEHLLVLNYLANCSKNRFSVKTALTDSENMDYDLSMINRYEEDFNTSLNNISDFDLEQDNEDNNSFNSEMDDGTSEIIDIKSKSNTKFVNNINSNNSVKDILDKDFIEIKELLLNKNAI